MICDPCKENEHDDCINWGEPAPFSFELVQVRNSCFCQHKVELGKASRIATAPLQVQNSAGQPIAAITKTGEVIISGQEAVNASGDSSEGTGETGETDGEEVRSAAS